MLEDIGPWDFAFGEAPEELLRVEPDGKIIVGDIVLDGWVEVVKRIRATECLPAWVAEQFGWGQRLNYGPKQQGYKICDMLIAYSEALEGSDE